jgi:hypothetical protein
MRASIGLVAGLLAFKEVSVRSRYKVEGRVLTVVAEPLRGRAHLCESTSVAHP